MYNIKPCWWGDSVWKTIYCITAVYPDNPTKEHTECIKNFFLSLKCLLPCKGCRESYLKISDESNTNANDIENFKNKDNLIKFVYCLRNKVNDKLTHDYLISLNYFKKKLQFMTINEYNKFDGKICEMNEAPIISEDIENDVFIYLKIKTTHDINYSKKIINIVKKFMKDPVFDYNNNLFKIVYWRNKKCRKLIKKINHKLSEGSYDVVQSFKKNDKNLHESLLFLGCSILHRENLKEIIESVINSNKNKFV